MVHYKRSQLLQPKSFRAKNLKNDQNQIFIFVNCINVIQMCPSLVFQKETCYKISKLYLLADVYGLPRCLTGLKHRSLTVIDFLSIKCSMMFSYFSFCTYMLHFWLIMEKKLQHYTVKLGCIRPFKWHQYQCRHPCCQTSQFQLSVHWQSSNTPPQCSHLHHLLHHQKTPPLPPSTI